MSTVDKRLDIDGNSRFAPYVAYRWNGVLSSTAYRPSVDILLQLIPIGTSSINHWCQSLAAKTLQRKYALLWPQHVHEKTLQSYLTDKIVPWLNAGRRRLWDPAAQCVKGKVDITAWTWLKVTLRTRDAIQIEPVCLFVVWDGVLIVSSFFWGRHCKLNLKSQIHFISRDYHRSRVSPPHK